MAATISSHALPGATTAFNRNDAVYSAALPDTRRPDPPPAFRICRTGIFPASASHDRAVRMRPEVAFKASKVAPAGRSGPASQHDEVPGGPAACRARQRRDQLRNDQARWRAAGASGRGEAPCSAFVSMSFRISGTRLRRPDHALCIACPCTPCIMSLHSAPLIYLLRSTCPCTAVSGSGKLLVRPWVACTCMRAVGSNTGSPARPRTAPAHAAVHPAHTPPASSPDVRRGAP